MTRRIRTAARARWRLIVGLVAGVLLALTGILAAPVGTYSYSCHNTVGHANGGGFIGSKNSKTNFEFEALATALGPKGHLRVRTSDGDEFSSVSIDCFEIAGDSVILRATGLWNGSPGYTAYADGTDGGNGHSGDNLGVTIRGPGDHPVFEAFGTVTGGNINIHGGNSGGGSSSKSGGSTGGQSGGNPGGKSGGKSGGGASGLLDRLLHPKK